MRLQARLTLLMALATLIPLLVTGVGASQLAREAHVAQARELYARQADGLAVYTETWLGGQLRSLSLAVGAWDLGALGPAQQEGLLRLLYTQFDAVLAVGLLDPAGAPQLPPLAPRAGELGGALAERRTLGPDDRDAWLARIPRADLPGADPVQLGAVWSGDSGVPLLGVRLGRPGAPLAVGVVLSLEELDRHLRRQAPEGGSAVLLDAERRTLVGDAGALVRPTVVPRVVGTAEGSVQYPLERGGQALAAFHTVGDLGWTALVSVPLEQVTRGGDLIAQRTLFVYFVAVLLVVAMAWIGSRQMSRPILALRDAAQSLAQGELGVQVPAEGQDEVGELSRTFNQMSAAMARDQRTIATKNAEIEAWNAELLQRVEQRTQELQRSQRQLVATSRMAAVAEMGAGLAHELNNPVAAILGMAQIARMRGPGPLEPQLAAIEEQAQRCATILRALTRFTDARTGQALEAEVDLHEIVAEVLGLVGGAFRDGGQALEHDRSVPLRTRGDPALLAQAFAQVLRSLRTALGPGGRLFIHGSQQRGEVQLRFRLSSARGAGGDDWLAYGMGFWTARQILEEHGGRLDEPDGQGEAVVYTAALPAR